MCEETSAIAELMLDVIRKCAPDVVFPGFTTDRRTSLVNPREASM